MRWDSDHVVLFDDELQAIANELVRGDVLGRSAIGLDYFDASINRIAAWVIGMRNMRKALLKAMLEPTTKLKSAETTGDYALRMADRALYEVKAHGRNGWAVYEASPSRSPLPDADPVRRDPGELVRSGHLVLRGPHHPAGAAPSPPD